MKNKKPKKPQKPKCSECGSTYIYTLADGTLVCRTCGNREKKNETSTK